MYHGLHISGMHTSQDAQTISFCTMEPNICAAPLWSLPHITHLTPGMLIWSLDLRKMCGHLIYEYIIQFNISYGLDNSEFEFRHRQDSVPFSKSSRPALGPTQHPIQ
jgi:hypothetical protein